MAKKAIGKTQANKMLDRAIETGDIELARLAVKSGANLERKSYVGCSALVSAIFDKRIEIVRLLLEHGANANPVYSENGSPLHYACKTNQPLIVQILLEFGANPNAKWIENKDGAGRYSEEHHKTPLFFTHNNEVLGALKGSGADVNACNYQGRNALFQQLRGFDPPDVDFIEGLLGIGLDPNLRDVFGDAPITKAYDGFLRFGLYLEKCKRELDDLLSEKANEMRCMLKESDIKDHAEKCEKFKSVLEKMKLSGGLEIGFASVELCHSCRNGDVVAIQSAIANGASVGYHGNMPLLEAVQYDNPDVIKLLVSYGASIDCPSDEDGKFVVCEAARLGKIQCLKACVELGASTDVEYLGTNPLNWAKANREKDCESFLRTISASRPISPRFAKAGIQTYDLNYQVIAIRMNADEAAGLVSRVFGGQAREVDASNGNVNSGDQYIVFRFVGQDWSCIYSFSGWMQADDAARLAAHTTSNVLWLQNSDTAFAFSYQHWIDHIEAEKFDFDGESSRLVSNIRKIRVKDPLKFVSKTIKDLGITITGLSFQCIPNQEWRFSDVFAPEIVDEIWIVGGSPLEDKKERIV